MFSFFGLGKVNKCPIFVTQIRQKTGKTMMTFEVYVTPKGSGGFTVRLQAKNRLEFEKMLKAQYPNALFGPVKTV
jgi:hypothetical protein